MYALDREAAWSSVFGGLLVYICGHRPALQNRAAARHVPLTVNICYVAKRSALCSPELGPTACRRARCYPAAADGAGGGTARHRLTVHRGARLRVLALVGIINSELPI